MEFNLVVIICGYFLSLKFIFDQESMLIWIKERFSFQSFMAIFLFVRNWLEYLDGCCFRNLIGF